MRILGRHAHNLVRREVVHLRSDAYPFTTGEEVIARLREELPSWTEPLYQGDEERRKMADSVVLTIKTDNGHHNNYTIQVKNHSKFDVDIKCISLWSKGQRVSEPAFPPATGWPVPADRTIAYQFDAKENVAYRLHMLDESPQVMQHVPVLNYFGPPNQFRTEVMVELQCEVLGFERNFKETRSVQMDFINRQITGL